ncbi:MAG: hypothetical protein CMC04_07615 [Flavobacteriaceae bacterium]|nr:hypothetical protein [Flavobacteriaceae bacterium]|tara:strand:+ start:32018 stop:32767 length:750 start_codon:yes stop_codon:yes gene_type:complete
MKKLIITVISIFFFFSCSSKKKIIYLQDSDKFFTNFSYQQYKIKSDDILKIDINLNSVSYEFPNNMNNMKNSRTKESMMLDGFLVDANGYIDHPELGKLLVTNKTLIEVKSLMLSKLINSGIYVNPSIDLKVLNSHFTVLGEVNKPGKYDFFENDMNILKALGMAGDLTISGNRDDIRLLREVDDKLKIINIDLTQTNILSDSFQIFSRDVIIVNPNTTRVKNAGIIGNSGTLLSLLSFILTSIIVINN